MATVKDVLKSKGHDVWSIEARASMEEALALMAEKNIGALMVYAADELLGIVSERDYSRKGYQLQRLAKEIPVREVMSPLPIEVRPETTLSACMRLMTDHRMRHLPVKEEGRVVGVISIGDVVNATIREHQFVIKQLEEYIAGLR